MPKYKKKPVVIDAMQFRRDCFEEIEEFTNGKAKNFRTERCLDGKSYCDIETLEGVHIATEGDYIIKGVKGEFYPCKPDIFDKTYEKVEECENLTSKIRVNICGCDDSTIFDLEVNESELLFMKKLSDISVETSEYGCQPIIEIEEEGK